VFLSSHLLPRFGLRAVPELVERIALFQCGVHVQYHIDSEVLAAIVPAASTMSSLLGKVFDDASWSPLVGVELLWELAVKIGRSEAQGRRAVECGAINAMQPFLLAFNNYHFDTKDVST
jgi:hypothetical protein